MAYRGCLMLHWSRRWFLTPGQFRNLWSRILPLPLRRLLISLPAPPQVQCRNGAVGMPVLCQLFKLLLRWQLTQMVDSLNGLLNAEVVDWQNVLSSKNKEQKHLCSPSSHASYLVQSLYCLLVRQVRETWEV